MECGNHEDVRWAALTGAGLPALEARAEGGPMQVSALPYTDEQLAPPEYSVDLPASTATVLTLSAAHPGRRQRQLRPAPARRVHCLVGPGDVRLHAASAALR